MIPAYCSRARITSTGSCGCPYLTARAPGDHSFGGVRSPVSLVSLAAIFLEIISRLVEPWVEGAPLPTSDEDARSRHFDDTVTVWDSVLFGVEAHVRTLVTRD